LRRGAHVALAIRRAKSSCPDVKPIVFVLVLALARVAAADDAAAKVFSDRGANAYSQKQFTQALVLFQRAYREDPQPALLFNIAECERQLGSFETAAKSYRDYAAKAPNAPNHDEAETLATQMDEAALAAQTKPVAPVVTAPALTAAQWQPEPTPLYEKWWVWTAVGGAVVVGLAVGIGVGVARYNATPTASTALGTTRFQ
jgi:tetratricopeptide (TPR) repeat protein